MRGIKIPLHDFALKMQGGLMREGGRICGTLWYLYKSWASWQSRAMFDLLLAVHQLGDDFCHDRFMECILFQIQWHKI